MKRQANNKGRKKARQNERKGKRKGKRERKGRGQKRHLLNDTDLKIFFKLIQMNWM